MDEPGSDHLHDPDEQEGGPVKSFLEHLEDLRWVLIKSVAAGGIAMLVCLLGANYVIGILEWPLYHAPIKFHKGDQTVRVLFGTNQLSVLHLGSNDAVATLIGTNHYSALEITPITIGTNQVLGLVARSEVPPKNEKLPIEIVNLSPAGSFVVATKIAFYGGLVLASPFIFYQLAIFIFPALKMREKKYIFRGLLFGGGLFLVGVGFCYRILMPIALAASVQYSEWLGLSAAQWRAEDYVAFVCKFMVGMGLGFELPVVVLILVKIGLLSYKMLAAGRRYVLVICFVLGAVLTTPEVVTQVLMAGPLYLLYEITVWIAWYWDRQEKKREALDAEPKLIS